MSRIPINVKQIESTIDTRSINKIDKQIRETVLEKLLNESHFNGHTNSIKIVNNTSWGEPNSWYKSGKFLSQYATINTDDWLKIHDMSGHIVANANEEKIKRILKGIENDNIHEIPTAPFELKPETYGEEQLQYVLAHEGRCRGVAAKRMNKKRIPIYIAIRKHYR